MRTIPVAYPSPPRRLGLPRRGLRIAVLLFAIVMMALVGIVFLTPGGDPSPRFTAGSVDDFAPGSVTYFDDRHVFLVRMAYGSFTALADSAQHLNGEKVEWRPEFDFQGVRGWFRSPLHNETFSVDGSLAFGPARSDMKRFFVSVAATEVRVDTSRLLCPEHRPAAACAK